MRSGARAAHDAGASTCSISTSAVVALHRQILAAGAPEEMARSPALMLLPAMSVGDPAEMLGGLRPEATRKCSKVCGDSPNGFSAPLTAPPWRPGWICRDGAPGGDGRRAPERSRLRHERYVDAMKRTVVNPWPWSVPMGYNQGEVVEGAERVLYCAGQTSVDATGAPQHAGDMGAQISLALDNLEAVLSEGGMGLANVVRLNIYTTDVDAFFATSEEAGRRMVAVGVAPPATLLGVARLAFPELMVELEATAVA